MNNDQIFFYINIKKNKIWYYMLYLYRCLVRRYNFVLRAHCSPCRPSHYNTDTPTARRSTLCTVRGRNRNSDSPPSCSVFRSIRWRIDTCHSCIVHARCSEDRIASDCTAHRTSLVSSRRRCPRNVREDRNQDRTILKHGEAREALKTTVWSARKYGSVLVSKQTLRSKAMIDRQINKVMKKGSRKLDS